MREYTATAEDYGIEVEVRSIRCLSPLDVMVQAAEEVEATIVFAHLPETIIPYWRKFQHWTLERQLMSQQCQLYTLDKPATTTDWVPSISVAQRTSTKS